VLVDAELTSAAEVKLKPTRIRARSDYYVVLEMSLRAIEFDVDTRINAGVNDPGKIGDVRRPVRLIRHVNIVCFRYQFVSSGEPGSLRGVQERHHQRRRLSRIGGFSTDTSG
jgi:hypothetical protein